MSNKYLMVIISLATFLLVGVVLLFVWSFVIEDVPGQTRALEKSLQALVEEKIGVQYKIQGSKLNTGTDSSGVWWIVTSDNAMPKIKSFTNVGLRDDEKNVYLPDLKIIFGLTDPLEKYLLYKGEAYLGKDSICEDEKSSHCNLHIAVNPDDNNLFVWISRI